MGRVDHLPGIGVLAVGTLSYIAQAVSWACEAKAPGIDAGTMERLIWNEKG